MRAELMAVAALAGGGAAALGVSACGSSNSSKSTSSAASAPTATTAATPAPPKPTTIKVTVSGATVTVRLATLGFNYCRANPRTCAAVKSSQLDLLTQNQRNAVKAAQTKVKADDAAAAANQPAPAPAPAPQPAPAPAPPPSSGGGTTTG
jgi:hypothetical protein